MGKNPEQEIQKKLIELELAMNEEEARRPPAVVSKKTGLAKSSASGTAVGSVSDSVPATIEQKAINADLCTLGGLGLTAVSIVLLCTHIHVQSAGWGFGGLMGGRMYIGLFMIPIFVGITMLFNNYRSRVAQIITAGSVGLLLFTVLMQLQMTFASVSLLGLVLMVVPLCAGISLLLKGHYKRLALTKSESD